MTFRRFLWVFFAGRFIFIAFGANKKLIDFLFLFYNSSLQFFKYLMVDIYSAQILLQIFQKQRQKIIYSTKSLPT
jgi:hypothetical protein